MSSPTSTVFGTKQGSNALASFSTILKDRSDDWSHRALALKYELEYKPVEQERKRVATELHDEVLPLLSRLSRFVQRYSKSEKLLRSTVNEVIDAVRHLLGELHPVDLEELGLSAAIDNLCSRYTKLFGNRITYRDDGQEPLLPAIEQVAIYRALQLVIRMFAQNGSGQLLLSRTATNGQYQIELSLADTDHSAVRALISEMSEQDLEAFSGWSSIAQMRVQLLAGAAPHRVIFSVPGHDGLVPASSTGTPELVDAQSQARLFELESVVAAAQEEWAQMLQHDVQIAGNMAVAIERQRLCRVVEELVYPGLEAIATLAVQTENPEPRDASDFASHEELLDKLAEIKAALDSVVTASYPAELVSLNLVELVRLTVERFKRATMINTRIVAGKLKQLQALTLEEKIAAFRIIHEALHNVEKHSQASTLLVLVEQAKKDVIVYVEDNGLGIGDCTSTESRGIRSIKEHAKEIGASVSWQKSISYESGTLVTIRLPIG